MYKEWEDINMYKKWEDCKDPTEENEWLLVRRALSWFLVRRALSTVDEMRGDCTNKDGSMNPAYVCAVCDAYDWTIDQIASLFMDGDHYRDEIADFLASYDFEGDETLDQIKDEFLGQHRVEVGVHPSGVLNPDDLFLVSERI